MTADYPSILSVFRLPLLGECHFLQNVRGYFSSGFIWFAYLYGFIVCCTHIIYPHVEQEHISSLVFLVYLVFCTMTGISLLRCNLSNPGRIPFSQAQPVVNIDLDYTACKVCKIRRPPRAHHCSKCRQCVMKMDHHCFWINNCVAKHNMHNFMQLCSYAWLMSCTSLLTTALHFYHWPQIAHAQSEAWSVRYDLPIIHLLIFLSFGIFWFMSMQVSQQHLQIFFDRTTLERFIESQSKDKQVVDKPMKLSLMERYRAVFPPGPICCWLNPLRSPNQMVVPMARELPV